MIYAHRRHKFTLEKVYTNILHLGLGWLFFSLTHSPSIYYRCFIGYPYVQGSPLQASERSDDILPSDKTSLDLYVQRTKLFEVKKNHVSSRKRRPRIRAPLVKLRTSGLWNSLVVFETLSGDPYWSIRLETRYWETSCQLIPAWISNHMHAYKYGMKLLNTYPFPNFSDCPVEVWEWIRNFSTYFIMDVIIHPCRDWS